VKTKTQKDQEVQELQIEFQRSPNALLVGFQGIKVGDDERLRRELRQAQLNYRVVKNTLAVRAAAGTPIEQLSSHFSGPTAIALSKTDPVTLAKILSKWAKENPHLSFKAGMVEGRVIEVKDIEALANLPSKEELISKMMFLVNSGAQRLAVALAGVARNLAVVIDQVRAQKEGGSSE
jgi:large subunit ribosomal protein L10